jgi:spore cortex biosynthesis protein YabQ
MNQEIAVELHFFAFCILWGGLVLLAYDSLRIIRRLIKHGTFFLAVEDLIFWIITGIFIFTMIYRQNNGIIRGFAIMGMSLGMLLYHLLFNDHLVNIVVKGIRILLKPFAAVLKVIKKAIAAVNKKVQIVVKVLLKQLKLADKSIKMNLNKKHQKRMQKRHEKHLKRQKRLDEKAAAKKKTVRNTKKADKKLDKNIGKNVESGNRGIVESRQQQLQIHRSEPTFQRLSEEELKLRLSKNRR